MGALFLRSEDLRVLVLLLRVWIEPYAASEAWSLFCGSGSVLSLLLDLRLKGEFRLLARSLHVLDIYEKEDFPLAQISSVMEVRLTRMPLKALRLGIRLVLALLS